MAQNQQTVFVTNAAYTQLTNADAASITFQVLSGAVYIRYTTDTTAPAATLYGALYRANEGALKQDIADLTYLTNADRVWARAAEGSTTATVYVDHA